MSASYPSLQGKVTLVTGASRSIGIGAAIAKALAESGAHIFTSYYRPYDATMPWGNQANEAETLLADLRALGSKAAGLEIDLSDPAAPAILFDAVEKALGPVDILVNNATYSTSDDITNITAESLDRHYAVNVRGMILLCREFVQRCREGGPGRIINLSSGQGFGPMPGELAYVATKGAVEAFTLSLSAEPAVTAKRITVNAIDPGITDTGWIPSDLHAAWTASAPLGRVGLPEDAAHLIRFLASAEGGWITGQVIHSRGGL